MKREVDGWLDAWLSSSSRKPLVMRGARQVGKTWLARDLAARHGRTLVELNFERDPAFRRFFASNDPRVVLGEVSLWTGRPVSPESAILFLDEIQAVPDLLAKLRWFAEEMPELPVVAAGSLLEFSLAHHTYSMPVGRIAFLHVGPMGFAEFLAAHGQDLLRERLNAWCPGGEYSPTLHEQALAWARRYAMVGGMPAVVQADVRGETAQVVGELQLDLAAAYRADFAKYSGRLDVGALQATLDAVARSVGRKFVYARVGEGVTQQQAKRALEMLAAARVCHVVRYTPANGLPLAAEAKDSFRKVVLVDAGLLHALLRMPISAGFPAWQALAPQVRGQLVEQVVGQLLWLAGPLSGDGPELYYWQREGGRPGEVDYVVQSTGAIVPVELRSGTAGAMKSLHQFMFDKKLGFAVRFDESPPADLDVRMRTTLGDDVAYRLRSLPWYLAGWRPELLVDQG